MVLMALGVLGDLLWMFYWVPFWMSEEMAKWNKGVHSVVMLSSLGECVLKCLILASLSMTTKNQLKNATYVK